MPYFVVGNVTETVDVSLISRETIQSHLSLFRGNISQVSPYLLYAIVP